MECPVCRCEMKNDKCSNCKDKCTIFFMEQGDAFEKNGDFDKALEEYSKALKTTDDETLKNEITKRKKIIYLEKYDTRENLHQDEGDKKSKKIEESIFRKYIPIAGIVLIMSLFVLVPMLAGKAEDWEKLANIFPMNIPTEKEQGKTLKIMMIFNFDDGFAPITDMKVKWGYKRLIETLLKYDGMEFTLSFTGTSLKAIQWYSPETIVMIREGIKKGRFKIAGTLYSYNSMLTVSDNILELEVVKGRESIEQILKVIPDTFIWPEDIWSDKGLEIIKKHGYSNLISKCSYSSNNKEVERLIVNDMRIIKPDTDFTNLVNKAVDAGDAYEKNFIKERGALLSKKRSEFKNLFRFINKKYREKNPVIVYSDYAEIIGAQDTILRRNGEWDIQNLTLIIDTISNTKWIETEYDVWKSEGESITMSGHIPTHMDEYAYRQNPNYLDYKGYIRGSEAVKKYKEISSVLFDRVQIYKNSGNLAGKRLAEIAEETVLSHLQYLGTEKSPINDSMYQYEERYTVPEGMKEALTVLEAAENTTILGDRNYKKDVNGDNIEELVVIKGKNMYVFSIYRGGRLLGWYDIYKGEEIIGGEAAELYIDKVSYDINVAVYGNDTRPLQLDYERYYNSNIKTKTFIFDFARFLVTESDIKEHFDNKLYFVKQKGLNETLYSENKDGFIDKTDVFQSEMEWYIKGEMLVFKNRDIVKTIQILDDGIKVLYNITGEGRLFTETELNIGYSDMISSGMGKYTINNNDKNSFVLKNFNEQISIEVTGRSETKFNAALFGIVAQTEFLEKKGEIYFKR